MTLAPLGAASARERVDVDLQVDVDLGVVARAVRDARDAELRFEWDWGDGERSVGAEARHHYARPGRYLVTLTVEDEGSGRCWTEERWVRVDVEHEREERDEREREDAREDDDEREDDERSEPRRSRAGAAASASLGRGGVAASVALDVGHRDAERDDEDTSGGSARVRSSSHDHERHAVPGVDLAALLPAVGALAAAWRLRGRP
ncbi:MAG: PKD domain-containing protein [Gemmatimonadota bacterium]